VAVRRVVRIAATRVSAFLSRLRQVKVCTYSSIGGSDHLNTFLQGIVAGPASPAGSAAAGYYREHRFDLLGSGWTRVHHGMRCRGIENISFPAHTGLDAGQNGVWLRDRVTAANLSEAQRIWGMIDTGYTPIDWQLDFKSGYRWNEKTWYRDIRFLNTRGADVKVPWELSRLQHLPQLAVEFGRTGDSGIVSEIRNQLLDWIAANPPQFGVNWFSTMDVAIRAANMVVAYDLAISHGARFDDEFKAVLRNNIYDHALHIVGNLEWSGDFRGNHYLSNVAGLLFAAAYLGDSVPEYAEWVEFAIEEIVTAVEEQFHNDGSNFEASTSYHRLSAEMVVFSVALVRRLRPDSEVLPDWMLERIWKMAEFSTAITKPDGTVVQVGDNDSGRFLKIAPPFDLISCADAVAKYASLDGYDELPLGAAYPDERHLDHSELTSAVNAVFGAGDSSVVGDLIRRLAADRPVPRPARLKDSGMRASGTLLDPPKPQRVQKIPLNLADHPAERSSFRDFGLFIFRSPEMLLSIRCGSIGQNGIGGHAHNDQLSFDLTVEGLPYFQDPGSYIYTPLPERRNEYRSARAHNGPRPANEEPGSLRVGLFRIVDPWQAECVLFSGVEFVGVMHRRSQRIFRRFVIEPSHLLIQDWAWGCTLDLSDAPERVPFSPGYGIQVRTS
jgi:hypothetical protein